MNRSPAPSTQQRTFVVNRRHFEQSRQLSAPAPTPEQLQPGQLLLAVDRFAFTANNITYAAMGKALRYWEFFPAEGEEGIIPVWGFADVIASRCEGIEVGERIYGYYPMASHLRVEPVQVSDASFVDGSEHRRSLPVIYNQYIRSAVDPIYRADTEALQMLLRPLFTTSFLLDDFFIDNQLFGARSLVLTSASSKTALGMAFLLSQQRDQRTLDYEVVGLTSARNRAFVESLGCYDRVLEYGAVESLDPGVATAIVDFAGMGELLGRLHRHFDTQLTYSCLVGAAHWDARAGAPAELPGAAPEMFFAPTQAQKRLKEWGGAAFQQRVATAWATFLDFVGGWMRVEEALGGEAAERVYQQTLAGDIDPQTGYILSLRQD
ncbi:DUF2855 family protein [Aestuariirhabdus litorea]|uniref:DUF2855 family protein n=1 Tax=Aestuariirhabdus litorea TaxID=2528527 RepID=A0A3P3VMD3_9GAMM|nr:DUF2855 family protein [Aestuariirhabdus litorea]RRJ83038.1 DUF2855 family protein [Aestuariirhabdus litorea]RWW93196.1 DUF2855 family protein [Endozoicomonadaceae bacterium GTF-13]